MAARICGNPQMRTAIWSNVPAAMQRQWKAVPRTRSTGRRVTAFVARSGFAVPVSKPSALGGRITVSPYAYIRGGPHAAYQALLIRESATL